MLFKKSRFSCVCGGGGANKGRGKLTVDVGCRHHPAWSPANSASFDQVGGFMRDEQGQLEWLKIL
jgi:hypothetical protein